METGISPERRYINSRLNIHMFYKVQLSIQPRQRSLEEKARFI